MGDTDFQIRFVDATWLDQICEIENQSFPTPWSRKMIEAEFHKELAVILGAVQGDQLIGYVVANTVMEEAHILTLAVAVTFRKLGVATALLQSLVDYCDRLGAEVIYLEVREQNRAAQDLYRKMGFEQIGVRRGYYIDTGETALILARRLGRRK